MILLPEQLHDMLSVDASQRCLMEEVLRHPWLTIYYQQYSAHTRKRNGVSGGSLPSGSNSSDGARLDVSARSVWMPLAKAFFDIRVFNPLAKSNKSKTVAAMYRTHKQEKKRLYKEG